MLAKKYRLPIQLFYKKSGKSFRGRYFLIKVFNSEIPYSRAGVVISRKVAAKATERNRIKRIVFNFFREYMNQLPIKDYLIILSPAIAYLKKEKIFQELSYTLNPV